jgi:DNA polymerase I
LDGTIRQRTYCQVHKAGNLQWGYRNGSLCTGCKHFSAEHDDWCDSTRFFNAYNARYPEARKYQERQMAQAEKTGYAEGIWGERWFLPGVQSPHEDIREAAKRQAFALPIQGGNARLIKQAMTAIRPKVWEARARGLLVEPILQIHDELLFHTPEDFLLEWVGIVKPIMETVATLKVPIVAEAKAGPSWLEQEKL